MDGPETEELRIYSLEVAGDEEGFTAAWVSQRADGGDDLIGANYPLPMLGTPFVASFDHPGPTLATPTIAPLERGVVLGWERAANPTRLYAQAVGRNASSPSPIGGVQELSSWLVGRAKRAASLPVAPDRYLHLWTTGSTRVAARQFDLQGNPTWEGTRSLPVSGPTSEFTTLADMDAVPDGAGFALALSHGRYVARYRVSLQRYDADAGATSDVIPVLPRLAASGDIVAMADAEGAVRVFWTERHPDFALLASARVLADGRVEPALIEYWTDAPDELAPGFLEALSLDNGYLLTWSNNAGRLFGLMRDRLEPALEAASRR